MASRGNPNPTGSKPDKLMRDALMVALKREATDANGQKTTKLAQIAEKLVDLAVAGDVQAIKEISDRVDGKPAQAITGADGGALQFDLTQVPDDKLDRLEALVGEIAAALGHTGGETTPGS